MVIKNFPKVICQNEINFYYLLYEKISVGGIVENTVLSFFSEVLCEVSIQKTDQWNFRMMVPRGNETLLHCKKYVIN